jgi:hypothetical protein
MAGLRRSLSKVTEYAAVILEAVVDIRNVAAIVIIVTTVAGSAAMEFVKDHPIPISLAGIALLLGVLVFVAQSVVKRKLLLRQVSVQEAKLKQQAYRRELNAEISSYRRADVATRSTKDLHERHRAHLAAICHTTAATFNALKPSMAPFSVNIKHIVMADPNGTGLPEPCYLPVVGTWTEESERGKYTQTVAGRPTPIESRYWYSLMFNPAVSRDYFAHHDRRELVAYLDTINWSVPNKAESNFFLSWFAMPIYGLSKQEPDSDRNTPYIYASRSGKMSVVGILCVDSAKAGVFHQVPGPELAHDIALMQELAQSAFASYEAVREVLAGSGPALST